MRKHFLLLFALCATMMAWGATVTVTKTAKDLGTAGGWSKSTAYATAKLDDVITITVTPGDGTNKNGTYYIGDYPDTHDWRMYQARANGQFAIKAVQGYVITSVTLTYEVTNTGVVSTSKKETNVATPAANQILSGTAYPFANSEITFYVGNTTAATTNGQARIRSFSVTYEKAIVEEFKTPEGEDWNFATDITSVEGKYYTWTLTQCRYNNNSLDATKTHGAGVGMWKKNSSSFVTTAEGGVKAIAFYWNQMSANESNKTDKLAVWLNGTAQSNQAITGTTADKRGEDVLCILTPTTGSVPASWPKDNCELKLTPGGHTEARVTFGPITIVPYLRYTYTETQQVKIGEGTFDCSLQIDNTDEGTITYSSDNACVSFANANNPTATLNSAGTANITATWSEGASTTFTLEVIAKNIPEVSFAEETVEIANLYTTDPVANALTVTEGAGEVTYTSSNPLVAEIEENKVYVVGVGEAIITATTAENDDFVSGSASYTLTVAEPTGETAVSEDFEGKLPHATSYQTNPVDFTDQDSLYFWTVNGHRYDGTWVRFATNENACMTSQGVQEGGIKRLAFTWKRANGECPQLHTTIKALDKDGNEIVDRSIEMAGKDEHTSNQDYNMRFEVKQNAKFYLRNESDGFVTLISDIKIVPYLLYTKKDTIIDMSQATNFINDKLIDNRDDEVAIVYSIVGENDEVASINAQTGEVTGLKAGTVTVQAAWGEVTTTYSLTINSKDQVDAKFVTEGKVEKVLADGSFTNAVVITAGDATPAYTSDNTNVAEVNASTGEVTIKAIGTATITATMAETDNYFAWEDSYTLVVRTGIENSKKLVEHFTNMPKSLISTEGGDEVEGDIDITWLAYSTRRGANDTIGGAGVQGNNIFAIGYVDSQEPIEGGIKYFSFNWKQWATEKGATLKLVATIDGVSYEDEYEVTDPDGKTTYEHFFFGQNVFAKKNVAIKLENKSYNTQSGEPLASNGRITFDAFEIVPYLYYNTKSHTIDHATIGGTYTNTDLINNIDNNEGTITYSLISEGADAIASIDETGEVTVKAGGVVTVQAKWVADATKQDEFVTTTYELTINFPTPIITFNDFDVDLDGTVTPDITVMLNEEDITETATISYEVADKNIATWDATNGWKLKTNGTTQVTAKVERTAQYGAASATATMTVNTMTFAEGTFFTENFGGETTTSYSTQTEDWRGKDNVYPWTYLNWIRYENRVRIRMSKSGSTSTNGYIYMNPFDGGALEGGIKAVQVTWKAPGASSLATDFYVDDINNSATKVTVQKEAGASTAQQITQAIFNSKTNAAQLRIRIGSLEKSAIDVYSVDIVPYLLYTKKEVPVTYELEGTNTVDATANLINNLEENETVTYSLSAGAQATIDGSTITLANATEDVIVTATCGDVSTTFTLKVTKAEDPVVEPDFVLENKTAGAYATICLPKKIAKVENATLYSISYGNTQMIEFVEADLENDDAGMPYLVQVAADGDVNFYYGEGDAVDAPVSAEEAKGFVGSLQEAEQTIPSDGTAILVSGGQLHIAGEWCVLTQNHAYITTEYLPETATPSSAPRRTIRLYNAEVTTPTALENGIINKTQCTKVVVNGRFIIMRNAHTYSAQGMLIK